MVKVFTLATNDKYKKDIEELNKKLQPVGVKIKIVSNEYGNYLNIILDDGKYKMSTKRNAGRKPHLFTTIDETELIKRVEEVGTKQVAEEEGVSVRTIQRRVKRWK